MDVNIFIEGFNKTSELVDLSAENCVFGKENNFYTHYLKINENTLVTLTSLPDGTIHRVCITFDHSGSFEIFEDGIKSAISSFANEKTENSTKILNDLKIIPKNLTDGFSTSLVTDWYTYNCESSKNATVFIIRAKKYSPETNTSPTLKKH